MEPQPNDPADFVDYDVGPFDMPAESNPEQQSDAPKEEEKKDDTSAGAQTPVQSVDDRNARSVFVKNVHFSADKKEIEEHFADCGEIKMITILTNKMTHQPLGFCYIEFSTAQGATNALAQDGSLFKGRLLTVHPKRQNVPNKGRAKRMQGF